MTQEADVSVVVERSLAAAPTAAIRQTYAAGQTFIDVLGLCKTQKRMPHIAQAGIGMSDTGRKSAYSIGAPHVFDLIAMFGNTR